MADFKVIRGSTTISSGNTERVLTEGSDYTLESGVTSADCFARIVASSNSGGGDTSGGIGQTPDDIMAYIKNDADITTSLTFVRYNTNGDTRVKWEIVQYIGSAGGANEFIVRLTETKSGNTDDFTSTTITTIGTKADCVPFITGQASNEGTDRKYWSSMFEGTLVANGADWDAEFYGYYTSGHAVSYAVVEFTGSNWRNVQEITFTGSDLNGANDWDTGDTTPYDTISIPTTLLDLSKALCHVQYRYDNNVFQDPDDCWFNVELGSTTQLYIRHTTIPALASNQKFRVWVMENTQSTGTVMSVQHYSAYDSTTTGTEEVDFSISITSVSSMDTTGMFGCTCSTTESGSNQPRGGVSVRSNSQRSTP